MQKEEGNGPGKTLEDSFVIYDPENIPYEKHHICEIISNLPELTPEEIERYQKE